MVKTIDLYLEKLFEIYFFPFEKGNFWLFQQARCEVIIKYTNCNLLEQEWIRTGIRTLETQTEEKDKNIKARKNVTGSCKNDSVFFFNTTDEWKTLGRYYRYKKELWISVT